MIRSIVARLLARLGYVPAHDAPELEVMLLRAELAEVREERDVLRGAMRAIVAEPTRAQRVAVRALGETVGSAEGVEA